MALEPITLVSGRAVPLNGDDIDTDRIIPARFMKCVTFDGLGEFAFYDVRFAEDGSKKRHPLNESRYQDATILISGSNFGCGSSREHAPQSLYRYGFRAVIAESFAEIFFGNSITLGMPCVILASEDRKSLAALVDADASLKVAVDLEKMEVRAGKARFSAVMADSARDALLSGRFDPIAGLLEGREAVDEVVERLPYINT